MAGRSNSLEAADITADRVGRFLAFLETARQNSITTRNARLAALYTFARFLVAGNPDHMAALQQVLGIPFKRGARAAPIEYLGKAEIEVLLAGIDRSTLSGQRDYAMFSLMFNTGARVQEILNLHVRDVRLEFTLPDPPCRQRQQDARLSHLAADGAAAEGPDPEATCRRGKPGRSVHLPQRARCRDDKIRRSISPAEVHVAAGSTAAPTLAGKRIHPHLCATPQRSICSRPASTLPPSASGSVTQASTRRCDMRVPTSI